MIQLYFLTKSFRKAILFFLFILVFSQCLFAQPANDNCNNAITRTSGTSCNNTQYRLRNATASAGIPVGCAPVGTHYDVWFQFIAVSATHTVTISNLQANITNPRVQLFSGTCAALVSRVCGTTTLTDAGLTIGNTYYVRVSNLGAAISNQDRFDICITHPNPPPANDNCSGATLLTSAANCVPVTGNLRYATNSAPTGACGGATATTTFDVWYRFQATSTTHAVTVSNLGANLTAASTYLQVLSGACGASVSMGCQAVSVTGGRMTFSTLTIGAFYYVRVYVTTNPTAASTANWNFNICVQQPPANDECAGAVTITSNVACNNTTGTLDLATPNATVPLGCFAAGTYYDVWYRFVATSVNQTITLSGVGTSFSTPRIQIYSGFCGTLVSLGCASAYTITQGALVIGTPYYIRVANFGLNPSGTNGVADFDICVTAVPGPPGNDNCTGAISLTSNTVCSNTSGTLIRATASSPVVPGSCGNALAPDVWFSFVAQSAFPSINLSSIGVNLYAGGNARLQLLTGSCSPGPLTPVGTCYNIPAAAATTLNTATNPGGVGLTIGQTYYIRITHNTLVAPVIAGTYTFNICVTDPIPPATSVIDYAKSYINITDGLIGGTINPGDVLEIRATLVVRGAAVTIDSVAYFDTLRNGAGFVYNAGTLSTRTNEGKIYQSFTDAVADDAGFISPVGAHTGIRMNIGTGATSTARGRLTGASFPSFYGGTCIIMATYRVTVSVAYGTKINFGGGAFTYRTSTGDGIKIEFPRDSLMVFQSVGVCPNALGLTNILGDEFNGTFGVPPGPTGTPQNRGTSPNTGYAYQAFNPSGPNDYFYGVPNNTSANNTIVQTVPKPGGAPRVFGVWDITGDHTGAANTAKGNRPCNTAAPISSANPCGYMLVVNAAYRTDVAFSFTVSGACPSTYYEISTWIKNICYKCGCDVNGRGNGSVGYIPTAPGDSSGVRPNLAFEINGVDYYTTGDIPYQGLGGTQTGSDTLNNWVNKSFVYKTGSNETGFVITLRNNAPGGGGNDWAMDDISLKTCHPNMSYSPFISPIVCTNNTITITDTIRSYFDTYVEYKWQRSTNGGTTWLDIPGTTGTATPLLVNGQYEFITAYTLPPAYSTLANDGDQYRVVVATTVANLAGTSCNYSDVIPITLDIISTCRDIDDDNDGIPDYVEFNNPVALQDADLDAIPNWNDPTYPGFVDNNLDAVNDNFDYGADSDNDGTPNYLDPGFAGFIDSNGDGVNDNSDKDLDGIPNQLDLDSDNDGIPDVVESYGVDTDGDGIIDNYVDTDNDGFSQNVDANNTGVNGSANGLGARDFDGDGIGNYLDTDSDNDGIPDMVESGKADANNNGKIDVFADANFDGISDNDVNLNGLLKTGPDVTPVDGRADNFPNKNLDRDFMPNAYDLDSDDDGIVDVIEAGITDANLNGVADGALGSNGWSTVVSGLGSLNPLNTDATGNPDYLDIDSDDDGIPDNIEGMSTAGYIRPTSRTDSDGDGLVDHYDNVPLSFSGSGIFLYDYDLDGIPDFRDLDTDSDGSADIIEGNDFNLNGIADDLVTLTGLDTDGDGLDNRFDSLNSVTNIKGTSYNLGTGGSAFGDPAPGTRAPVQKKTVPQPNRDWRYIGIVLPLQFLNFSGELQNKLVPLSWTIITTKDVDHFEIERSTDNRIFNKVGTVSDIVKLNEQQIFGFTDDISNINNEIIYYRLKVIDKTGEIKYSNIIVVRRTLIKTTVTLMPNPASNYVNINMTVSKVTHAKIMLTDKVGKKILVQYENLVKGNNNITVDLAKYSEGVYAIMIETSEEQIIRQLVIIR